MLTSFKMNTSSLVVVLLALAATASARDSELECSLKVLVARWTCGADPGLPWALPPAAQLDLGPLTVESGGFTLKLSNVYVRGLDGLVLTHVRADVDADKGEVSGLVTVDVPVLYVHSDEYDLQGTVFDLHQRGHFQVVVRDVTATLGLRAGARAGDGTSVRWLGLEYTTGQIKTYLSGSLVTGRVTSAVTRFLRDEEGTAEAAVAALEPALNRLLAATSPLQVVAAIKAA